MAGSLFIKLVEKPWGQDILPSPFVAPLGQRIGEIWFEPPHDMPELLVKYIFTSEALSVQVHPSDSQTIAQGIGKKGKEECWLVLDAKPDAKIGIGFNETIDIPTMREAALDGSIEQLINWHSVKPGDFFYISANTVHAIGAGISLIEIQQNSDITYRLYDYGRPRELHLYNGLSVAKGEPCPNAFKKHVSNSENVVLVDGPYFQLDQVSGLPSEHVVARYKDKLLIIPREGSIQISGKTFAPGECALANHISEVIFMPSSLTLLTAPV